MTKTSKVDTKIGEDGDAIAILGSLFQRLITLTFKKKYFPIASGSDFVLLCFAGCKSSLSSPWKFPSVNILVRNNEVYLLGFFF